MKACYYACKDGETIRITHDKHIGSISACKECYGIATDRMQIMRLGSCIAPLRSSKKLREMLSHQENWKPVVITNKLGLSL